MQHPDTQPPHQLLTINLSSELYTALLKKIKITGKTETELVIEGLRYVLDDLDQPNEEDRFRALELALENKLKQYVESLIKDRFTLSKSLEYSPKNNIDSDSDLKRSIPIPTIRPLQIGDRVLILETDSPYYMAKLLVVKTSLIRATVATDKGDMTFLKRDLRFVEAAPE
jgi:translation initiation factor 2 beta subunit (eIF-2beta)/eIF-5